MGYCVSDLKYLVAIHRKKYGDGLKAEADRRAMTEWVREKNISLGGTASHPGRRINQAVLDYWEDFKLTASSDDVYQRLNAGEAEYLAAVFTSWQRQFHPRDLFEESGAWD